MGGVLEKKSTSTYYRSSRRGNRLSDSRLDWSLAVEESQRESSDARRWKKLDDGRLEASLADVEVLLQVLIQILEDQRQPTSEKGEKYTTEERHLERDARFPERGDVDESALSAVCVRRFGGTRARCAGARCARRRRGAQCWGAYKISRKISRDFF